MNTARILVNLYDGDRQLLPANTEVLLRVRDGDQEEVFSERITAHTITITVPFYDNLRDNYTVLASANGRVDAGYFPVKVSPKIIRPVFLMLLPRNNQYNFREATAQRLSKSWPKLWELFSQGAGGAAAAQERYSDVIEKRPASLACLLNIVTVMKEIHLPKGVVLDYMREVRWDDDHLKQDRFMAYCDPDLLNQVRLAAEQKMFVQEPSPGLLHPGATCSYKQVQFGEANLQLTFHEKDAPPAGTNWLSVEPDIDYFKDLGGHALLEVLPGFFPAGTTDPKMVYVLRWIAGHQSNVPEFDPPYTIRAV